jgi:hypothetical protein
MMELIKINGLRILSFIILKFSVLKWETVEGCSLLSVRHSNVEAEKYLN